MKTKLIFCLLLFAGFLKAQTDFVPGYYIINSGAKYINPDRNNYCDHVLLTYDDGTPIVTDNEDLLYVKDYELSMNRDFMKSVYRPGQVVFAVMVYKNRVYCFSPNGDALVFSSISDLTKAPDKGSLVVMEGSEELMDGPTLCCGYYWITSQNTANGTVILQLPQNKTVEIKQDLIVFYNKWVSRSVEEEFKGDVKSVEED